MKFFTTLLLVACSMICVSQNLIPNHDWELGPDTSSDPFNGWLSRGPLMWTPVATPDMIVNGSPAISRDAHPALSGQKYCVFYGPTPEGGTATLTSSMANGTMYKFSCWLNCDSNFLAGPGGMIISFSGANSFTTRMVSTPGQWVRWDTSFVASGNSNTITITATGNNLTKVDSMFLGITFPTNVKEVNTARVRVWPNPVDDYLNIQGPQNAIVEIRDLSGKLVAQERTNTRVNVSTWQKGLYFARVRTSGGVKVEKFVIK